MKIRSDVYEMAVPVLTEQLFITSIGVLNTIIASGLGKNAISAIGAVDSFNNIIIFFFNSLAVGGTVIVAQYAGQGNNEKIKDASCQSIFSSVIFSFIITIIVYFFRNTIMYTFYGNIEKEVLDYSVVYFSITLLTYPLVAFSFIASGILRGSGRPKKPMKINIIINIINIILSYLLIYGIRIDNFNINGMGVKGAAIAVFIARFIGVFLFIYVLADNPKKIKIKALKNFSIDFSMQKSILNVGIPSGIETLIFNIGKFVQQIFIISLGTASIASNTIAWSVFTLLIIPGSALSIVATTMVGNFMGMKNENEAEKISFYLMKLATICKLIISIIVFPLATFIASIYSKDTEVIYLTAQIIRLNAIAIPIIWPLAFIIPSGLRGAGDSKFTMIVSIVSLWIFRVLFGYLFSITLNFGIIGLWIAMYFDWITRAIIYYKRLKKGAWKKNIVI